MGIIQNSPGYVYFARADNGLVKIGCTGNIDKRIKQIEMTNAGEIEFWVILETNQCVYWERFFHDMFLEKRHHGEWFALDVDDQHIFESLLKDIGADVIADERIPCHATPNTPASS